MPPIPHLLPTPRSGAPAPAATSPPRPAGPTSPQGANLARMPLPNPALARANTAATNMVPAQPQRATNQSLTVVRPSSLVARINSGDGLQHITTAVLPTAAMAAAQGAMNASPVGTAFAKQTGIQVSTVYAAVAAILRFANLDRGFPMLRRAHTAFIQAEIICGARTIGSRAGNALSAFLGWQPPTGTRGYMPRPDPEGGEQSSHPRDEKEINVSP